MKSRQPCQLRFGDATRSNLLSNPVNDGLRRGMIALHPLALPHNNVAGQAPKRISMLDAHINVRRMTTTPDSRRAALRSYMLERETTPTALGKRAAVSPQSIFNFLNGRSDSLSSVAYGKIARVEQVPIWRLTGDKPDPPSPTQIMVVGHVEAGEYRDALEWDRSDWYPVDVPVPERFRRHAKALEVRGTSMNVAYRPGAVVIWVDVLNSRAPRDGDRVIVYTRQADDSIEATVKELRVADGEQWLWPRSFDPAHQQPINPMQPSDKVVSVEIVGLVVGSYQPEIM